MLETRVTSVYSARLSNTAITNTNYVHRVTENADKKLYQVEGKHEQTQGDNGVIFAD